MRVLLINSHDTPEFVLPAELTEAATLSIDQLAPDTLRGKFAVILIPLATVSHAPQREQLLHQLKQHSHALVAIVEDVEATDMATAMGFDDVCLKNRPQDLRFKLRLAEKLESLTARLEQAQRLEAIGELAAGIAHEINTPIQFVGDNTRFVESAYEDMKEILETCRMLSDSPQDLLQENLAHLQQSIEEADVDYLLEEIPAAVRQSLEGVDRVAHIVRAMKEFSHPGVAEMAPTDLVQSIENTILVARNEWKYVAEIETDFDTSLSLVPCFPGGIHQVLLNLLVNAAHAVLEQLGPDPSRKGRIKIQTRRLEQYAEIRVIDSGTGISPENLEHIFDPFFTTKAVGKGTGQGLAIAHQVIVEKHGGAIAVESEIGKGTTFILRLPLEVATSLPVEPLAI